MMNSNLMIRKAQIVQSIMNDVDDESLIDKLEAILTKNLGYPATMSIPELKREVMQSVDDANNGKGITHEELVKKYKK